MKKEEKREKIGKSMRFFAKKRKISEIEREKTNFPGNFFLTKNDKAIEKFENLQVRNLIFQKIMHLKKSHEIVLFCSFYEIFSVI